MINNELLEYIKHQLNNKVSRETITSNLKLTGWLDADVNEAFLALPPVIPQASVPVSPVVPTVTPGFVPPQIQPQPSFVPQMQPVQQPAQPVWQSANPVASPVSYQPSVKSKAKKIFSIIIVLILISVAGGGAYAYYTGVFVSLPALASQSIDSARAANSASYDTTIDIDYSGVKDISGSLDQLLTGSINSKKMSLTVKGSYDISDPKNTKSSTVVSASIGLFSLGAEFRVLNETLFGILTKAPTLDFLPMLSSYENKWVSFPLKSENGQDVSNPLASVTGIDPNITNKLTQEQKDHIYKISRDAHFVKMVKRFTPETVGGELSYHFLFDLDREGITAYLKTLKEYINTIGKNDSVLSSFDSTSFSKNLDNLKDFKGEIWIGRNDKLPHKIVLNLGIQPDLKKDEQVKFNMIGIFSGWNQPVTITAPAESVPFETFISSMMGQSIGQAQEKGQVPAVKKK